MFLNKPSYSRISSQPIVRYSKDNLRPGQFHKRFRVGVKTVILEKDNRIKQLWKELFDTEDGNLAESILPWETNVFTLAQNHQPGNNHVGHVKNSSMGSGSYYQKTSNISINQRPQNAVFAQYLLEW